MRMLLGAFRLVSDATLVQLDAEFKGDKLLDMECWSGGKRITFFARLPTSQNRYKWPTAC